MECVSLDYAYYLGGSEYEDSQCGDSAVWEGIRKQYHNEYPRFFPEGCNVNYFIKEIGDLAWVTREHPAMEGHRFFAVFFKETITRKFLNFIFLGYEDPDGAITKSFCSLNADDWVKIKQYVKNKQTALSLVEKALSSEIDSMVTHWESISGLAYHFPVRYKNVLHTGIVIQDETLFPVQIEEATFPEEEKEKPNTQLHNPVKKNWGSATMALGLLIALPTLLIQANLLNQKEQEATELQKKIQILENKLNQKSQEVAELQKKIQLQERQGKDY